MYKEINPRQDFIKLENEIIKFWEENNIQKKYLTKNKNAKKRWSFLDGPMTANNPMGVHHAWGRTLKDLWQRFYTMNGYKQRYQNGFDCQGLWVEVEVEKELGFKTKKDIENYGVDKFVNKCKERVNKYADIIADQSKRLAEWMYWDQSYFTMSEENNYTIWHFLKVCYENNWIYEGTDSVPWCPRCGTAISQHEILTEEYKEITHDSIFFLLPIKDNKYKNINLLVWTTTPWTIPANVAVAVDPEKIYSIVEVNDKKIIIVKSRVNKILGNNFKHIKDIQGEELIGLKYDAPFSHLPIIKEKFGKYEYQIVSSDSMILPVSEEEGTGMVHIAPGAGSEDFQLGKLRKLPVVSVIDESANYINSMGEFAGKNAKEKPELIFDFIKAKESGKYFYKIMPYKHRYPTCWRCKTELVWRNVEEWYIAMDRPSNKDTANKLKTYRQRMIEVAKKINWIPKWGKERELDWLNNMHDWLISKKRYWGLALPIWKCVDCGSFEVIGSKEELKKKAVKGWDKFENHTPHKPWIDEVEIKCKKCGKNIKRIPDVGNPWLDAGIVPFSTYIDPKTKKVSFLDDKKYWQEWFPVDFITECFPGQFKNWFYALIAMSTALTDENPYKNLLGHALVKDEHGEEMHKSKGNAINFHDAAQKMGVDVMRWIYASQNPVQNLNFGYTPARDVLRRFILTLWNIYLFFVTYANIDKYNAKKININSDNILDKWVLCRLKETQCGVYEYLKKYNSYKATMLIEEFINDLSTWYLRNSRKRRSKEFYNTMHFCLLNIVKICSIFIPHISEAIYQNLKLDKDPESVHLCDWPKIDIKIDDKVVDDMQTMRQIVEVSHSLRREAGIKVRQPLDTIYIKKFAIKDKELINILKSEINIKNIVNVKDIFCEKNIIKKEQNYLEIGIDTTITEELKKEGYLREIIRQIQFLRKKSGYKALDEIEIFWQSDSEFLNSLFKSNLETIKNQTIAKKIFSKKEETKFFKNIDFQKEKIYIAIK